MSIFHWLIKINGLHESCKQKWSIQIHQSLHNAFASVEKNMKLVVFFYSNRKWNRFSGSNNEIIKKAHLKSTENESMDEQIDGLFKWLLKIEIFTFVRIVISIANVNNEQSAHIMKLARMIFKFLPLPVYQIKMQTENIFYQQQQKNNNNI